MNDYYELFTQYYNFLYNDCNSKVDKLILCAITYKLLKIYLTTIKKEEI